MLTGLELTLVLLAAAILAVMLLRRFGLPPLVAYLAVGIVLGPYAAETGTDAEAVHHLAELGVVFLMFSLGLEFSLAKLRSMRHFVFGLGAAQVAGTLALVMAVVALAPAAAVTWLLGDAVGWTGAFALGAAAAMSSTALVTALLAERHELETEHGRRVFSVLLFQDLAIIPLLIVIPALSPRGDAQWGWNLALALGKAGVLLVLLLRFGPPLMRRWFHLVARQRSHELFTLNVLLASLLFAWLTKQAGLSMELGAFVAGMLIAETEFRYQVEEDIKPFRDVLLGLFFVTIGLRLDLGVVASAWPQVLLLALVPVLLKAFIVLALVRATGGTTGTAIRSAIWLAQAGEFGFVLLGLALDSRVLSEPVLQPVFAAMLVSVLVSPLLAQNADRLALRLSQQEWLLRSVQLQAIARRTLQQQGHVIVCGYGRCGQSLAHVLEAEKVPYVALDLDPDRVREAAAAGEPAVFGDATRRETLRAAGLHRARALAITYSDTPSSLRLLAAVRELAPQLPVLVRTAHEADIERLLAAGATEVVHEVVEGSLMLASHALALAGVPLARVAGRIATIREGRYALLQGFFQGADDRPAETIEEEHVRLHAVPVAAGSRADGRRIETLELNGARLTVVVRHKQRHVSPAPDMELAAGDVLVLSGTPDQLGSAETWLVAR